MKDKKIGIIGGVGPQASHYLYGKVMQTAQRKYKAKNNDDFPELVLYSIPVPDFISNKNNIKPAMKMFKNVIFDFKKIGVSKIAIASNTVHALLPEFEKLTEIEFISLIEAVVEKVKETGHKKVGLLSSPMTSKLGLYKKFLDLEGVELVLPSKKDKKTVERIIRAVISGKNNGGIKNEYVQVVDSLFKKGAEGIILGCTELPLAINYEAINNRVYNSMEILAEKITDEYYA